MGVVHIINGDSLKTQWPKHVPGEVIIARETMIEGDVKGNDMEAILKNRGEFFKNTYDIPLEEYYNLTRSELNKILVLPSGVEVNLWFEDDLFCQTNLWFVAYMLVNYTKVENAYLIRPTSNLRFGFGGMDEAALSEAYEKKVFLKWEELKMLNDLWCHYQNNDLHGMEEIAHQLKTYFPLLCDVVAAHQARIPTRYSLGEPKEALISIIKELKTKEFVPVFKAFNKRQSIYGFGDLQVKRMFDEVINLV